ncbi:MAG: CHASE domain-containing protein [Spirochaetales bacterium]
MLPLLFTVMVIVSFSIFSGRIRGNEKTLCEGVAFHAAQETKAFIGRFMDASSSLKSALEWNPSLTKSSIEAISNDMLKLRPFILGVSTAPSAIVKYHFPESGNESLIGHDLLSNPERRDALTQAAKLKSAVISGPFESVEGPPVLFVRYPVFASGKLWGFVSLTVDFENMIQALGMDKNYPGFTFAFSEETDNAATPTGSGVAEAGAAHTRRLLSGEKIVYETGVTQSLELPGAAWSIHVRPSRGWTARILFSIFSCLLASWAPWRCMWRFDQWRVRGISIAKSWMQLKAALLSLNRWYGRSAKEISNPSFRLKPRQDRFSAKKTESI